MARITTMDALRGLIPAPVPHASAKLLDHLCDQGLAFIKECPFLVLGTMGAWGLELSPKGDDPGFVEVVDDRTLLIPERKGNKLALSLGNILGDARVALMMMRPTTDEVLRISGRATLLDDPDVCERLSARGAPAILAIRVDIDRAAFHCVRSARRAGLWEPGTWNAPTSISFGKIYADALNQPEIRESFDKRVAIHDAEL